MARSGKNRNDEPTKPTPPDESSSNGSSTPPPKDPPPEDNAEAKPEEPKAASAPTGPEITADKFVRGKGAMGGAFLASLRAQHGKRFPKKTKEGWNALYEKFLKAPR